MAGPGTKAQRERMSVFEAYERARKGPKVDEAVWNFEIIPQTATRLKEKYGIEMDKSVMVPTDPEMMKKIYQAGLEMLVECGVYCISTGRVIKYDRGGGPPQRLHGAKGVHDRRGPARLGACTPARTRTPVRRSSRAAPPALPAARSTSSASMSRTRRRASSTASSTACSPRSTATTRRPDTPWEVLAGRQEIMMVRMAQAKCGRSGMGL